MIMSLVYDKVEQNWSINLSRLIIIIMCLLITVSEAPKAAPIARKYDSRHELEEIKTTEQKKEEVIFCH